MRVVSGFLAAAVLAALAQPALAVCVYHGTTRICQDDPKPARAAATVEQETTAQAPAADLKTIVMQPSALTDNAWVMIPEGDDGGSVPAMTAVAFPACEPGTSC